MTDEQREKRIEAGRAAINEIDAGLIRKVAEGHPWAEEAIATTVLDAVDSVVPVVPLDRLREVEAERDERVTADWHGLLAILDTLYPASVFTGESGDPGARIVTLVRKLAEVEVERDELHKRMERYDTNLARKVREWVWQRCPGCGRRSKHHPEAGGHGDFHADGCPMEGMYGHQHQWWFEREMAESQQRAEKAERAARDLARALRMLDDWHHDEPTYLLISEALARHPEFAPERKAQRSTTIQRNEGSSADG